MYLNEYDTELYYWGPKDEGGFYFIDYDDTLEGLKKAYDERLNRLEELRRHEPPKKHNDTSKWMYRGWVEYSYELRDELNEIAEKIRDKCNTISEKQ